MRRLEQMLSMHIPGSDVDRINQLAGKQIVHISEPTRKVLETAMTVAEKTDGLFDPTIGVLKNLWAFDSESPSVPNKDRIAETLKKVDYHQIKMEDHQVKLMQKGMAIDLGGLAKGYIIDSAVQKLSDAGITAGIVDAGGDLRTWGHKQDGSPWKIGIRHPRSQNMALLGVIYADVSSIATSGDYERFFFENGKRYHHLLNPKTGYPANGCVSVTIMTETAMMADAYATVVFIMGPDQGIDFVEKLNNVECLIIYEDQGTLKNKMSSGMQELVHWH